MTLFAPSRLVAFAALLVTLTLHASSGPVVTERSTLVAVFKQMGVAVEGRFTDFDGEISFDPAQPDEGRAELRVRTASFDLGLPDYNAEVRKAEWFDSDTYPEAVFVAEGLTAVADGRYRAEGELQLKGKTQPLSAEIHIEVNDGHRIFHGELPLDRTAFAIGDPGWSGVVDDEVMIKFRMAQALP